MAMADLSSISGASAAAASAGSASTSGSHNNEQRFLKLLVTQLNNQDPLNPLQNAELTSQLAQMSTVSGIEKLNDTLSGLVSQSGAGQVLQAAALVGRHVLSPGATLDVQPVAEGEAPAVQSFAVELPGTAAEVTVRIVDARGETVRTIDAGTLGEGVNALSWDGRDELGLPVAAGAYRFTVEAANGEQGVPATALTLAQVAAVRQGGAGVTLDLATGQSIDMDDVRMYL